MDAFILRVTAYHGQPVTVGTVPTRATHSLDTPIASTRVVNDPNNAVVKDLNYASPDVLNRPGGPSDYTLDKLISDFEDEYGCMVGEDEHLDGTAPVFEFDVFDPSWDTGEEAKDVVEDLTERLVDWVEGYPTGR